MPTRSNSSYSYSAAELTAAMPSGLDNILAMFAKATATELLNGKKWYSVARDEAQDIANRYSLELITVVKVACALSPKMPWSLNMAAAEFYVRHYISGGYIPDYQPYKDGTSYLQNTPNADPSKPIIASDPNIPSCPYGGLKANAVKALWILQGHVEVLRGPKVQPFLDNIMCWDSSQLVTVDSHAIQVWMGSLDGGTYGIPPNYMKIIAADYIKAAAILGLSPLQVQAVTWLTKKRLSKFSTRG